MKLHPTRRQMITVLAALGATATATSCSRGGAAGSAGDSMEFFLNMGADTPQYKAMTKVVDAFMEKTGYSVTVTAEATNYEDQMKVKLASNEVPDLFSTHGWSLLRYSPYLETLSDQSWAADVNPSLDSAMRDENGDIYAFPGETDVAGILYSQDALEQAGVDPASLITWDDFDDAAGALADSGITPIFSSGKSQGAAGHIADYLAVDTYSETQKSKMKEGTFVPEPFAEVLDRVHGWEQNGWFNEDYASASLDDMAHALADGTAGFELMQTSLLSQALTYNPEARIGFLPVPGTLSDKPYLVGGEGVDSFGVSKTSPNKDRALEFLEFLAEQDNAAALAESTASAPGLMSVDVDFGPLASSFDTYVTSGTTEVMPYFDRVYLPNGSWNALVATTDSIISGQSSVSDAVDQMGRQYDTLFGQQ